MRIERPPQSSESNIKLEKLKGKPGLEMSLDQNLSEAENIDAESTLTDITFQR